MTTNGANDRAYLAVEQEGVLVGVVREGRYDVPGLDRHDYDYTVSVSVDRDALVPVVDSVECKRRPGGRALSARGVQSDRLGEVIEEGLRLATFPAWTDEARKMGGVDVAESAARSMSEAERPRPGRPPSITAEELDATAAAWFEAQDREVPVRAYVKQALDRAGFYPSPSGVKKRIDKCRATGRIPPADGTRPSLPR